MKKILLLLTILTLNAYSQSSGIGTTTPDPTAALEVQSTTKGVLPPRMTTAQRTAITSPATGLLIYNTDINCLESYSGTAWVNMCCAVPGEIAVVLGAAGKIWMAYNLGATAPAASATDYAQYGSLYQWGRGSDGHQLINWTSATTGTTVNGATTTLSGSDTPGHALFIINGSGINDWRNPQNNNLWQGINGINNPCPIGFRIPTNVEWSNEFTKSKINNIATAYSSCLKLVASGDRNTNDGALYYTGTNGYYWSSTVSGFSAISQYVLIGGAYSNNSNRAVGVSVRCIKD